MAKWLYIGELNGKKYYSCPKRDRAYQIYDNTNYCQHCGKKLKNPLTMQDKKSKI